MKAIVTGISGQDEYFLSHLILSMGCEVHGIIRRNILMKRGSFGILRDNIKNQIIINYGDKIGGNLLTNLLQKKKAEETYHLDA